MGGNGPHSGARNSSFGLATLRRDGYAAVRASATTSDPSSFNPNLVTTLRPAIPLSPSPRFLRLTLNSGLQPRPPTLSRCMARAPSSPSSSKSPRRASPRPPILPVACRLNPRPHPNPIDVQPNTNSHHRRQPADWSRPLVTAHGGGFARQPVGTARRECNRRTHRICGWRHLRVADGAGGGPGGAHAPRSPQP